MLLSSSPLTAQELPDKDLLNTLRERLLKPSEAFPNAAEIPTLRATIRDGKLLLEGQIHAAAECAVPLPGQFPAWSPLSVRLGDSAGIVSRRDDGYLWLWVPQGVHAFKVEGLLPDAAEWVWSFQLPPRQLELDAADWNVTGLRADGRPENQLFFSRKERATAGDSSYDQRNFRAIVQVDRMIEIGLVSPQHGSPTLRPRPSRHGPSPTASWRASPLRQRHTQRWPRRSQPQQRCLRVFLGERTPSDPRNSVNG
jgi:hypothetical protein